LEGWKMGGEKSGEKMVFGVVWYIGEKGGYFGGVKSFLPRRNKT